MLENTKFIFVKKHNMTPKKLVEELGFLEKIFSRHLFAGRISKKFIAYMNFKNKTKEFIIYYINSRYNLTKI